MSINSEFSRFVGRWLEKARAIKLTNLNSHFDRFFTLYVVYNRLYAEATFILARGGQPDLSRRTSFPDKEAATRYISQFLGSSTLLEALDTDPHVKQSITTIEGLIERNAFSIKLDIVTGKPQRVKDEELLTALRSTNRNVRATAILETIYAIRCNMFHGHKEFHPVQTEVLAPIMVVLEKVISLLQNKIENGSANKVFYPYAQQAARG